SGKTMGRPDWRWIIDPLDGTVNFAHGYPCYCVSIALQHADQIELGVIYNPSLDELFVAERGKGATLNGQPLRISSIDSLKRSLLVTGFAYNVNRSRHNNLDHFANFSVECEAVRRPGSAALDMCYVACGRFEGFWELFLHPWDYAAGWLLVTEAGGRVTRFDGAPFRMGDQEILVTNGLVHDQMIDVLKRGHSRGDTQDG
ncbi:MAG: inositol monophosphatase family protein, partial [Nitrospinaceae bacterium]